MPGTFLKKGATDYSEASKHMNSVHQLQDISAERMQAALGQASVTLLDLRVPEFLAASEDPGPLHHYKHFPDEARAIAAYVQSKFGDPGLRLMLHIAILSGMGETLSSSRFAALPARVRHHQQVQYRRMLDTCKPDDGWLDLKEDTFHKEFGLAVLRLYAGAAQLIDVRCGVPRSLLFKDGISGVPAAAASVWRLGGFSPYFQVHTHTAYLAEFNEEGWNECYRVCADLYPMYPAALGMFGASWFYDPTIQQISPRLAYLSEIPISGGAERLLWARDGEFVQDAISTSPSRRKLFDEGKYQPKSYLLAWARKPQTRWASRNPGQTVIAES